MMTKKESLYIINNNELYVKTFECGIPPLCVLADGLVQTGFSDSKISWMKVTRVIAWFENEIIECLSSDYNCPEETIDYYQQLILANEERIRQHITEGKMDFEPIIKWKGKRGY